MINIPYKTRKCKGIHLTYHAEIINHDRLYPVVKKILGAYSGLIDILNL